jgi:hypothetical protein
MPRLSAPGLHLRIPALVLAVLGLSAFGAAVSPEARGATACRWFAAAGGSGPGRGTGRAPFRSVQRLVDRLRPGQTGCLESGTYDVSVSFWHGGRRGRPITLTAAPGARARIVGRMYLPKTANHVRVTHLTLDGVNGLDLPSPTVDSADDTFTYDNVTNDHTAICFELGSPDGYGMAVDTLLAHNRIHDCGALPPTNHQHGVYVAYSMGARILDNLIYRNADRGIQLYWDAQRTTVAGNVIDRNGEGIIIGGDNGTASSDNLIIGNAITNSTQRSDVESYWADPSLIGRGNLVEGNCVYGGRPPIDRDAGGFSVRDNVVVNPGYADPAAADYRMRAGSPCVGLVAGAVTSAVHYWNRTAR